MRIVKIVVFSAIFTIGISLGLHLSAGVSTEETIYDVGDKGQRLCSNTTWTLVPASTDTIAGRTGIFLLNYGRNTQPINITLTETSTTPTANQSWAIQLMPNTTGQMPFYLGARDNIYIWCNSSGTAQNMGYQEVIKGR